MIGISEGVTKTSWAASGEPLKISSIATIGCDLVALSTRPASATRLCSSPFRCS